jgi:hypothetical protein
MTNDIDIYRSALLLLRQHGNDAVLVAASNADSLLAEGDIEGQATWKRIVRAIDELATQAVPTDGSVH